MYCVVPLNVNCICCVDRMDKLACEVARRYLKVIVDLKLNLTSCDNYARVFCGHDDM